MGRSSKETDGPGRPDETQVVRVRMTPRVRPPANQAGPPAGQAGPPEVGRRDERSRVRSLLAGVDPEAAREERERTKAKEEITARNRIAEVLRVAPEDPARHAALLVQHYEQTLRGRNYLEALLLLETLDPLKNGHLKPEDRKRLSMEQGQLLLNVHRFSDAYVHFRSLCKQFRELKFASGDGGDALWFLFKSWFLEEVSDTSEFMMDARHLQVVQDMEGYFSRGGFRVVFQNIPSILPMMRAFRRGRKADEEGRKGYDETIARGSSLVIREDNPRLQAERSRMLGAAHRLKTEDEREALDPKTIQAYLKQATRHNERAVEALRTLITDPDNRLGLAAEGGELVRVLFNYAKNRVFRTQMEPGDPNLIRAAREALRAFRKMAKEADNREDVVRSYFLESDLVRFGVRERPGDDELRAALTANERALDAKSPDRFTTLAALINAAQIHRQMGNTQLALAYAKRADELAARYRDPQGEYKDNRMQNWEMLRQDLPALLKELGLDS